MAIISNINWSW